MRGLELSGRRVLVLGLGVSGISAANFCARHGARVVAADERDESRIEGLAALDAGVARVLGQPLPDPTGFDLLVPSPGVPPARYAAAVAAARPAPEVCGDVELAWRALRIPIVAVTGTNGKSTTTRLVERMLRGAGLRARAAGNVGEPALDLVGEALDVAVLEISSFQLETTHGFRPRVAVVLNLTPDHLDRHGSFEGYCAAKARLLAQQQADDTAVLNPDDPAVRALAASAPGRVLWFRARGPLAPDEAGVWLDAGAVVLREGAGSLRRLPLPALLSEGLAAHDRDNALAALTAAWAAGADPALALAALDGFESLPHRMQPVARVKGVLYVDDSKATNPGAALRSLESCGAPVVWIAGGRDKGLDFAPLVRAAAPRVRAAVLIGEAAGKLKDALDGHVETHAAAHIDEAVRCAARLAQEGDVVLLAPACASQDQFRDYAERGERFRAAVLALSGEA